MGRLEGRTMVITGAGQGLGRTMTRRFVAEGARVIAAARNLERLQEAIAPLGDKAFAVAADLGDPGGVDKVFAEADKRFGKLDVLINNAAIYDFFRIEEPSPERIRTSVYANLLAPMLCTRAAVPLLRKAGGGDIINVSSETVRNPFNLLTVYAATKAGLESFSSGTKHELRADNIRVTTLRLGAMYDADRQTMAALPETVKAFLAVNARAMAAGGTTLMPVEDVATCVIDMLTMPPALGYDSLELRPRL